MAGTTDLDFGALGELATLLKAGGIRSADSDPAKVQTPGVWIRFDGIELDNLAGCTILTTLHLVVADSTYTTVQKALADLFNQVVAVLNQPPLGGPTGTTRPALVALTPDGTPLPALAVPLELLTTKEG